CEIEIERIYIIRELPLQPETTKKPKKKKQSHSSLYTPQHPSPQPPTDKELTARKIQAWWRGTLVRRVLLKAALSAWIIQCWWRKTLARRLEKRRIQALRWMAQETRACVTIQSWFRMLKIHHQYWRLRCATHTIQVSWRWYNCHTRGFFWGSYEIIGNQLRLHLDIFLGSQVCRILDCIALPIKN
uniref:IQ motif containing F4 n=1 Tax=Cricetulus griseus TaxID=10029 RepID=A0A8C2M171_CRIGR